MYVKLKLITFIGKFALFDQRNKLVNKGPKLY